MNNCDPPYNPTRDPLEGLWPTCTECGQEIHDEYWYELDRGSVICCPSCLRLNKKYAEDLLEV